ncbi:hypothetical protein GCM10010435_91770 [Winogradskya consettensis]|uniref:Uncharacterized protein n=1 Tax=Winogradskya consettensis TaxID=113560 RepID=A0A919T1K3_9ACTN|nr:hypothetical protein Aco04nite_76390 [Actinoplanes consettensis]
MAQRLIPAGDGHVGSQLYEGLLCSIAQLRNRAGGVELGKAVTLDRTTGYEVTTPVGHHAEAMGEYCERSIRAGEIGAAVGALVAERADDAAHATDGALDEVHVTGLHGYTLQAES